MKLLNPSPGFVIDRLTILDLKIAAADKRQINKSSFQAEKATLEEYLRSWEASLIDERAYTGRLEWVKDQIAQKKTGLVAVNSLLWEAYDNIRELSDLEMSKLAHLAKRIAKLTDSRDQLIQNLNELYGAGKIVEKIFGVPIGRQTKQEESQLRLFA